MMRHFDPLSYQYVWEQPSAVSMSELQNVGSTLLQLDLEHQWRLMQDRINEYRRYDADWDGYGSRPLSKRAFSAAINYLKCARRGFGSAPNAATLTPEGYIRLEWWSDEDIRQAEFGDSGQIEWMQYGPKLKPQHWRERFEWPGQSGGDTCDSVTVQEQGTDVGAASLT